MSVSPYLSLGRTSQLGPALGPWAQPVPGSSPHPPGAPRAVRSGGQECRTWFAFNILETLLPSQIRCFFQKLLSGHFLTFCREVAQGRVGLPLSLLQGPQISGFLRKTLPGNVPRNPGEARPDCSGPWGSGEPRAAAQNGGALWPWWGWGHSSQRDSPSWGQGWAWSPVAPST